MVLHTTIPSTTTIHHLVQILDEEINRNPFRALQPILALLITRIPPCRKPMLHPGKIHILPRHSRPRQLLKRILLQLLRIRKVVLRRQDLHRHFNAVDLAVLEERWVRGGNGVDERGVRGELEARPAAVAEADCDDFFVLGLEGLGAGLDFWIACVFAVASDEFGDAEVFGFFGVGERVWVDDFAVEAGRLAYFWMVGRGGLQVGHVYGRIGFLCVRVG
jgi:hypothetical protein